MKVIEDITLNHWGFRKKGCFPAVERKRIVSAVTSVKFKDFESYSRRRGFEEALSKKLGDEYTCDPDRCKVFQNSNYQFDVYNPRLKIGIEIEKTKTTTLLLDVIKFVVGNRTKIVGEKLVKYGVIIIPDKYRNEKNPDGQGDIPINRIRNELIFIRSILWIEDILIVKYDTSELLNK